MGKLKRYRHVKSGHNWCRDSDVAAVEAENERLKGEIERLRGVINRMHLKNVNFARDIGVKIDE
jgi:hypothetical protein